LLPVYEPKLTEELDRKLIVENILATLPEKEKFVLEHMFGLNGKKILSSVELAKEFGVSRQRIIQREEHALQILRRNAMKFVLVE
jgi:DNA-directed RNA polymerase sigma subunit (sigma70/sigma32)